MNYTTQLINPIYQIMSLGFIFLLVRFISGHMFHSIMSNPGQREELIRRYGRWAVETAEAVCPYNDWKCIEREADRLLKVRLRRI